jgi:hypothetical protein
MTIYNYQFDIVTDSKKSEYTEFNPSLMVNHFMVTDPQGKNNKAAFPTPGLSKKIQIDVDGGGRASHLFDKDVFVVFKDKLYRINSTLAHTFISSLSTESGHVRMANNNTQLFIVDGASGWIYDKDADTFDQIIDPNFPSSPIDCTVLNNKFLVTSANSKVIKYSADGDGMTWGANDFFSLQAYQDNAVGLANLKGSLYVFGEESTENRYFVSSGIVPFRLSLPTYEGCAAVGSIVESFDRLVWLSKSSNGIGSILVTDGGEPVPISNEALEREMDSYETVSDADAYLFKNELGHVQYVINFTTANKTWMFDFTTHSWSQLEYKATGRHLGSYHFFLNSKHYLLDYSEPKIYESSTSYYDDDGVAIRRAIINPITNFKNDTVIGGLRADLKQGTGLAAGNDDDPMLYLRISRDGGVSYANQIKARIGKIGLRGFRSEFESIGLASSINFEFEHYNKTPFVFLGLYGSVNNRGGG